MEAIKTLFILLILAPCVLFGQNTIYPKDTIYIKYENIKSDKNWNAKFKRSYEKKEGFFFNVENTKGDMALFYDIVIEADTLCMKHLKDYKFSNLKEIDKKRMSWIFDNKRPPADRNGVFQTYLIEVISKKYFVKYPVVWRNEGVVD